MVNWCIGNPLESEDLDADDPRMTAILAYISHERRGVRHGEAFATCSRPQRCPQSSAEPHFRAQS